MRVPLTYNSDILKERLGDSTTVVEHCWESAPADIVTSTALQGPGNQL